MVIRKLEEKDLEAVSAICMSAFFNSVAGTLTDEGVATFSKIAACDAFFDRMKGDTVMLVAESGEIIEGVIELKESRHVAMFFIRPERQKSGIGRKLLSSVLSHASGETVTVSASLSSVAAYEKYGFECTGGVGESAGLVYQPMELKFNKAMHAKSA
ncbi:GNAT family N-acetyltransferase [uncultured Alteromonas sp.]|jgi:GNAT superfamily N-acetyltransferase|uniref:GNAT family N-acetyltransferase n=1 Tax=uncultured Alteromonas sp. TaxID=179113 RepID=UPI0025D89397|nr:GNAT family N-acetyltransferase [uncultured Alteromonas sp.]